MKEEKKEMMKYILRLIASNGLIVIASQSPYFINKLIKSFFRNPKWSTEELVKYFRSLKYQGFVSVKRKNEKFEIKLTPKGKEKLETINFWDLKLEKEKKWDKKWRIIIFDIPKKIDRTREMFRLKLREFGFYQLQKSVWIYPYKCEREIAYLRELLGVAGCIKIIIAKDIELNKEIFEFFHLNVDNKNKGRFIKNKRICV